jgi:hypothetical protein
VGPGARYNKDGNLTAAQLPEVDWSAADHRSAAAILYRWTEAAAISTLNWYLLEKKSKARWSRSLRILSVLFIAAGGIAPLISVATDNTAYAFWRYPILGLGAACIGLDRAFGFSSSWMRYLGASAMIEKILIEYQLKWASLTVTWKSNAIDIDQTHQAIAEIRSFAGQLSEVVSEETETWIADFRGHVSRLEAETSRI